MSNFYHALYFIISRVNLLYNCLSTHCFTTIVGLASYVLLLSIFSLKEKGQLKLISCEDDVCILKKMKASKPQDTVTQLYVLLPFTSGVYDDDS